MSPDPSSADKTGLLWDAQTARLLGKPLWGHSRGVNRAAFSPNGLYIATASDDGSVLLWHSINGTLEKIVQLYEDCRRPIYAPEEEDCDVPDVRIGSVSFNPAGDQIVIGLKDGSVQVWDVVRKEEVKDLRYAHQVNDAAFSPNGERIVTASSDGIARLWDANSGKQIGELRGHESGVQSAAFSPDGRRIVTASQDKSARLWDANSGKQIGELRGHESGVQSAAFSPDGRRIVTASEDKSARIWDASTGKQLGELRGHESGVQSAAFSPDGRRIVTASGDTTARVWKVFPYTHELVVHAKSIVPRCLTQEQRRQFFLPLEPPAWCIEMEKWPYHTAKWKQWLADTRAGKNPPLPATP